MILPDGNLLIAFTWEGHGQSSVADKFFRSYEKVVTCPLTELNLVRVWMQLGASGAEADKALQDFVSKFRSRLIPCDISATEISNLSQGHRQTTDAYLAMLAKNHRIKIATLDEPFAKRFPSFVEFVV